MFMNYVGGLRQGNHVPKHEEDWKEWRRGSPGSLPTNYRHTVEVMVSGLQPRRMKKKGQEMKPRTKGGKKKDHGQKCLGPQLKHWLEKEKL